MKVIVVNSPKHGVKNIFVDDFDYEELIKYKWSVVKMPQAFYAVRYSRINGKEKNVYMHRHLMGDLDRKVQIDHIDHNGLNNQKSNLRASTSLQNQGNRVSRKGASSSYVGVCWHSKDKKWQAAIRINGRQVHLGQFDDEVEAALARDIAAKNNYGEFAYINIRK